MLWVREGQSLLLLEDKRKSKHNGGTGAIVDSFVSPNVSEKSEVAVLVTLHSPRLDNAYTYPYFIKLLQRFDARYSGRSVQQLNSIFSKAVEDLRQTFYVQTEYWQSNYTPPSVAVMPNAIERFHAYRHDTSTNAIALSMMHLDNHARFHSTRLCPIEKFVQCQRELDRQIERCTESMGVIRTAVKKKEDERARNHLGPLEIHGMPVSALLDRMRVFYTLDPLPDELRCTS